MQDIAAAYRDHVPYHVSESLISFQTSWPVLTFPYKNFEKTTYSTWTNPSGQMFTTSTSVRSSSRFVGFGVGSTIEEKDVTSGSSAYIVRQQTYDTEAEVPPGPG